MPRAIDLPEDLTSLPRTAAEARAAGAQFYFTGVPCRAGHLVARWASNNTCVTCDRESTRKWHDGHRPPPRPPRPRVNPEVARARARANAKARRQARMQEEGTEVVWAEERAKTNRRYREHLTEQRERSRQRRARGVGGTRVHRLRTPPWLTDAEREQVRLLYLQRGPGDEVDHVVPLVHPMLVGLHVPGNLRVVSRRENQAKGSTFDCTEDEACALVAKGVAIWPEDIRPDGTVDWSEYWPKR